MNIKQPNFPYMIRDLTTSDLDQYNALLRYAFQVTEQELATAGWRDDEIKQSKFPVLERADILGCYDGDHLISQFAVYPIQMNVFDTIYPIGFITSVSTYPEYTGLGIMSRLMYQSLVRMRQKGQSLALLYPYSIPLYRRFGWEIVSDKISYSVKDRQIPENDRRFSSMKLLFVSLSYYRISLTFWQERLQFIYKKDIIQINKRNIGGVI